MYSTVCVCSCIFVYVKVIGQTRVVLHVPCTSHLPGVHQVALTDWRALGIAGVLWGPE